MALTRETSPFDINSILDGKERIQSSIQRARAVVLDEDFSYGNGILEVARAIYLGVSGNISVRLIDGSDVVFSNLPAGFWFQIYCTRINSIGTTATNMVWGN